MMKFWFNVLNLRREKILSGMTVTILEAGTSTPAAVYRDPEGKDVIVNPITPAIYARLSGSINFYGSSNKYDILLEDDYGQCLVCGVGALTHQVFFERMPKAVPE
jgi:hypothetical protein